MYPIAIARPARIGNGVNLPHLLPKGNSPLSATIPISIPVIEICKARIGARDGSAFWDGFLGRLL